MNQKNNNSTRLIGLLAGLVIGFLFLASYIKYIKFYVNEEVNYNDFTVDVANSLESDISATFFGDTQFMGLNATVRNILGQREMNGVVKLNNGYLLTTIPRETDAYLQECADNVVAFHQYLKQRGTSLVYATPPYTTGKYDPELPVGVEDYGNDNIDRFLEMLNTAGVDTIDYRETMHEDGIDHYDMMYRTDHHWTTKAGFYAYGKLEDYIVSQTECNVDERISDIGNYTVTTYEKWHLGSRGQRTGKAFSGIDDFDLILPDFETKIKNGLGEVGSMEDLVFNMKPLEHKDYSSRYTYDTVFDYALGHYVNTNSKNDIKILIITDSFGKAVTPYLIMGFRELESVHNDNVQSVTTEYIEKYDPDVVIMLYYPEKLVQGFSPNPFGFEDFKE